MKGEVFIPEGCYITELANDARDPAVSVARARVAPGTTTCWHRLRDTVERYLIVAGEGWVEVGDEAPRRVVADDLVLIPAGVRQRIANRGDVDLLFLAICTPRFTPACYQALE